MNEFKQEDLIVICRFLNTLQYNYNLNDFCPADITLSKNGGTLFAKVKDKYGAGEIILHKWELDQFKDDKVY